MRIVIDLQGAQSSGSRNRGIGRYSLSITKAILENKKNHEIIVVLSSLFLETVELVRNELKDYVKDNNIRVWSAPGNVSHIDMSNNTRRKNAEFLRETFIASLQPDMVFITSLFEGLEDDAVTSIGLLKYSVPTAVVLYDLIPLINSSPYLDNPDIQQWYEEKIEHLKRADLLLSISESSKQEALEYLSFSSDSVVNIGTASDAQFKKIDLSEKERDIVLKKYNLNKNYLMYTGGIDHRKNIEGLIRSYALLKQSIRNEHQLAIVCSINDDQKTVLHSLAKSVGLQDEEVIFTGYILEDDLIVLYNLCKAFIFPSWHEGFGLPALEAMNCGAPVIASDRSSLPEVIGLEDALFDSLDDVTMSKKIEQILTDELFREKLLKHGKTQIKKFSWEHSAKEAIKAFEEFLDIQVQKKIDKPEKRLKLAYISPLPPQRSGISDYSAELLPSLVKYYDIDVIVEQESISDDWINKNCIVHDVEWFKANASIYDRVLYHFGNSPFHQHMFNLLNEYPGTVILHDFYLGHIVDHMGILNTELYYSHGYKPFIDKDPDFIWNYPVNKRVLDHAKGIIVHSDNSKRLADKWYGDGFAKDWFTIPLLRVPSESQEREKLRKKLGIPIDAFLVCSFGLLSSTKQNQKLLDAWLASSLSKDEKSYLIFVGENSSDEYGNNLESIIQKSAFSSQIKITGWTDTDRFREYLNIADIGVQLRTMSRGETSAAVLDCMNYGLATIINANGSMADINDEAVYKLADEFTQQELVNALEELYINDKKRKTLGEKAKDIILKEHAPDKCAKEYFEAIENFYSKVINENDGLIDAIVNNDMNIDDNELKKLADSISKNHQYSGEKQLFLDISVIVHGDAKSGIQRVVRSLLLEILKNPPKNFNIMAIYYDETDYRYATNFIAKIFDKPFLDLGDKIVDFRQNDIYLALDLNAHLTHSIHAFHKYLQCVGVKLYFIVYDILLVQRPDWWNEGTSLLFEKWLESITEVSTGLICISKAVANEVREWMDQNPPKRLSLPEVMSFHLGADVENSLPSKGFQENSEFILNQLTSKLSFLMVGTIEPRKGHKQILEAFEKLWKNGTDINLVIIGKEGWLVDDLVKKLRSHSELNKRLFWLEGISDEYLEKVYTASTCLIAASEGEGFGLPLIEAAQHKIPIIARDIPVSKEVAGEYAYYFENSKDSNVITDAVKNWLRLFKQDTHPKSDDMPWMTWQESTKQLLNCLEINIKERK